MTPPHLRDVKIARIVDWYGSAKNRLIFVTTADYGDAFHPGAATFKIYTLCLASLELPL